MARSLGLSHSYLLPKRLNSRGQSQLELLQKSARLLLSPTLLKLSSSAGVASVGKDGEPGVSNISDECCVYFCRFQEDRREGTGLEWVLCVCQRWLHEKCICKVEEITIVS